jgi:hypothetical protein
VWWDHGVEGTGLAFVEGCFFLPVSVPEEKYDECCEDEHASGSANYSADNCANVELLPGTFCVDRICLNVDVLQAIIMVAEYWHGATAAFVNKKHSP